MFHTQEIKPQITVSKLAVRDWRPVLRKHIALQAAQYGEKRYSYTLNPDMFCLSSFLVPMTVHTPAELLLALNKIAVLPDRPSHLTDDHLIAFLMSRWKGLSFMDVQDLKNTQTIIRNMAILRIFASIQDYFKVKNLSNLCEWMADLSLPLIYQYRNLKIRKRMDRDVKKAITQGQLMVLVKTFENRENLKEDEDNFKAAKAEHWLLDSEMKELESEMKNYRKNKWISYYRIKNHYSRLQRRKKELLETWGEISLF